LMRSKTAIAGRAGSASRQGILDLLGATGEHLMSITEYH
jgi:hypothetical protein